jgi:hypothetical protein
MNKAIPRISVSVCAVPSPQCGEPLTRRTTSEQVKLPATNIYLSPQPSRRQVPNITVLNQHVGVVRRIGAYGRWIDLNSRADIKTGLLETQRHPAATGK